jgi:hypothetical protein
MKNVKHMKSVTQNDQCFSARITAEELNITRKTVSLILMENLGMNKICAKMMPKNLTNDHLQWMTEAFTKVSL